MEPIVPSKAMVASKERETVYVQLKHVVLTLQVVAVFVSLLPLLPTSAKPVGAAEWDLASIRVCPRAAVCSEGWAEVVLLALARISAYWMLPPIAVVFLTKVRAGSISWNNSILSLIMPLYELHDIHVRMGWQIGVCTIVHTVCHVFRWALRGELCGKSSRGATGTSGLVADIALLPTILLQLRWFRERVSFEPRKIAHIVGGVTFGIAIAFHTRLLFVVVCIALGGYALDLACVMLFFSYRVEHSEFHRLGSGVQLTFQDPPGWSNDAEGYVNVLVPWISIAQWHPFSVYKVHDRPGFSHVFMLAAGDWTRVLHALIARDTRRPVWIQGPFASPFGEMAASFDNMMLVATGIGITPALSCIQKFGKTGRSVALIWSCRDAGLIAFYAQLGIFDTTVITLIFYTGKTPLSLPAKTNVRIIPTRPDLEHIVPIVIRCVEQNVALPNDLGTKAANFLLEMNEYAGVYKTEAARLRFDGIVRSCLKRGMTVDDLVSHFFQDARLSFDNKRLSILSGHWNTDLSPTEDAIDSTAFGAAFAILATDIVTLSHGEILQVMASIDPKSDPRKPGLVSRDALTVAFDTLHRLNVSIAEAAYAEAATRPADLSSRNARGAEPVDVVEYASRADPQPVEVEFDAVNNFDLEHQLNVLIDDEEQQIDIVIDGQQPAPISWESIMNESKHDLGGFESKVDSGAELQHVESIEDLQHLESIEDLQHDPTTTVVEEQYAKRWGMMYCGGSAAVKSTLHAISKDLGIQLTVEGFDW
ncbi:hypothetical protein CTAYLR_001469 [Chrysophaeum taylorii]|uniref:Ferric reductase NAD binding domain-containing protein n=1 Tax=Chrysophaeum taylorii TaxID=2483200 RepID=A0AAD7XJF9_9STRA|nr:hypothetical protein CTAYLR_001469 [Chrysophaeum taylorii]